MIAPTDGTDPRRGGLGAPVRIMQANKPRMMEMARELDFSPVQAALAAPARAGVETPMRALAQQLFCDPSNVTGIVDRLEARGMIERRSSETDRRVKIIRLTPEGQRLRARVVERMSSPPDEIAELPIESQRCATPCARPQTGSRRSARWQPSGLPEGLRSGRAGRALGDRFAGRCRLVGPAAVAPGLVRTKP